MIKPSVLKPGDLVAIVAPSRKVSNENIESATTILEQWGLQVTKGSNLLSNSHSYLSGTDEERLHDLQIAFNDPQVKAVFAARGGYGSTRIVDRVDLAAMMRYPKWMIGFSDITAIHLKLFTRSVMSIHGTMPMLFSKKDSEHAVSSLQKILFEGDYSISAKAHPSNRNGAAHGVIIGGNLSLIIDSLGTTTEPDTRDCILVIEEIDEYKYRIDRMLTQLRRAGKLKDLKGLVVGHMTDIKDSELPFGETVYQIVLNAVREYDYPVAFDFPSGHDTANMAWIHGGFGTLTVGDAKVSLSSSSVLL
jgi:muramoyltetrapeptide carboxypeptidase